MSTMLHTQHVLVTETPLDPAAALARVQHDSSGAGVLFTGVVRDHDGGRHVVGLDYSAHPSATEVMRGVIDQLVMDHPDVTAVLAHHRTGRLAIGDVALVVAVSTSHRAAAFTACADLVERIKASVPVWKHQSFADGSEEWVNSP
jgi:molybdopterin synthase catalytic subunit